jgi:predicted extracellular nuclease
MIQRFFFVICILILFFVFTCTAQKSSGSKKNTKQNLERGDYRIMFYNCENLYDTYDDSLKADEEFLPDGMKYWTWTRYQKKLANISKVITGIGGWDPPEIIGLCEIENRYVLDGLTKESAIQKHNYQIIQKESPDSRGIDVAFLYLKDKFTPISYKAIPVIFPDAPERKTRDILYVCGYTNKKDTLHIFVNHWPSRWGGELESEDKRIVAALTLRSYVDSIFDTNSKANILIMGDLNDFPENISVHNELRAKTEYDNIKSNELYNLS